ncbi:RNase III inhibitor [Pelomonas sp. Root1217]|uniref:O-acetyl-ADP-ribose deacetylase n=1 Tax=Pelomonas sp. Root1217 TaxID=1736430 RepID=UPI00070CE779|nr:O-acetyl-ADP-ribose deacetylase [Pelomonas sp. Root1217]KQV52852.1 RNase III inhibitor [Pelomonas sp. Root1217]
MKQIRAIQANITTLAVDAIVNAANSSLLGGGGVDGAIHRTAGPELLEACRKLRGCKTGQAKITPGFRLPASHIIHTVGPVWQGGAKGEEDLLRSCYVACLTIARDQGLQSIAFPSISTGAYGYPIRLAAKVAVQCIRQWLHENDLPAEVTVCCFSEQDLAVYLAALDFGL